MIVQSGEANAVMHSLWILLERVVVLMENANQEKTEVKLARVTILFREYGFSG